MTNMKKKPVADKFIESAYKKRGRYYLCGPRKGLDPEFYNTKFYVDKKAKVCQCQLPHAQEWTIVHTIQRGGQRIHFCHTPECGFCSKMQPRVARLNKYIESIESSIESNVVTDIIKFYRSWDKKHSHTTPLERYVDELLNSTPGMCGFSRVFPWDTEWARQWLDGERSDPPRYNIDIVLDKEEKAAGPEAAKNAVLALAAWEAKRHGAE